MALCTLLSLALGACASPRAGEVEAARALDYLESTDAETGADVVVAVQIYGEQRADDRARLLARTLGAGLSQGERDRYGALLTMPTPALSPSTLDGVPTSSATPNPADTTTSNVIAVCLDEALACSIGATCRDFVNEDDRFGYVLSHQAVMLLFARWAGCSVAALAGIDVEARRHHFASALVAETRADPIPGDLYYERLAVLAHLGFATSIEPAWVDRMLAAQTDQGCFPFGPGLPCHPHPTGLAVWILAHVP